MFPYPDRLHLNSIFLILTPMLKENFEGKYIAKVKFDMWTGGARDRITDHPISGSPVLPTEPQPPATSSKNWTCEKCVGGREVSHVLSLDSNSNQGLKDKNYKWSQNVKRPNRVNKNC